MDQPPCWVYRGEHGRISPCALQRVCGGVDYKLQHASGPPPCGCARAVLLQPPGSCNPPSHPAPLLRRVRSFPSHQNPGLEMRLGAGAPRLPKRRRCLLGAPGVGAPGSSLHPPVPAPRPCPAPQAPRAPLGGPRCTRPCTRPEPAPPGPRGQRRPPAPAAVSGELPGGVDSTPSATVSWAPLAFTGARCRVRSPWGCRSWGRTPEPSCGDGAGGLITVPREEGARGLDSYIL